jgi:hypothetical protein
MFIYPFRISNSLSVGVSLMSTCISEKKESKRSFNLLINHDEILFKMNTSDTKELLREKYRFCNNLCTTLRLCSADFFCLRHTLLCQSAMTSHHVLQKNRRSLGNSGLMLKKAMVKSYFWIHFEQFRYSVSHFTCHGCHHTYMQALIQSLQCKSIFAKTYVSNKKYLVGDCSL